MPRGGKRPGAGRKPNADVARLREISRRHIAARVEEMARLALEATNERTRAYCFDRVFRIAYGKELDRLLAEPAEHHPFQGFRDNIVWATDAKDAIPDPADEHKKKEESQ